MSDPTVADVLLHAGVFDYAIPQEYLGKIAIGSTVKVFLRNHSVKGIVLSLKERTTFPSIKSIQEVTEQDPLLPSDLLKLGVWMSTYYVTPLQRVFAALIPSSVRKEPIKQKMVYFVRPLVSSATLKAHLEKIPSSKQIQIIKTLLVHPNGLALSSLKKCAAVSMSPIESLCKQDLLEIVQIPIDQMPALDLSFFPDKPKSLSEEQEVALQNINKSILEKTFQTHLLYGITGSGKTEVYLRAIQSTLEIGRSALFLVPEIALTSQTIERLKRRFQDKIALLHHRLSKGQRYETWQQIRKGTVPIVVGARSALFSPIPNLGLLIVDEEHEPSYKQSEEAPRYHARDVAVMRGKFASATVILGSATPSLESYTNALRGKYLLSVLSKRADRAILPQVHLINMQKECQRGNLLFSDPLIQGIKTRLQAGEQVLLFLNRRGYHTSAQCKTCLHILTCMQCDVSLIHHLQRGVLACHLCGYQIKPPTTCTKCQENTLQYKGIGTEMVERSLHALLPQIRTLRLDADTTRRKGSQEEILRQFRSGKADVLIGTQMIAKGLHLPLVTLVGVIGIDSALSIPDFRASEIVFHLLTQVAGRAGRGQLPGEVLIQTHLMHHPIMQLVAAGDYFAFYQREMQTRELFEYPPFTRLIKLTFSGKQQPLCYEAAKEFRTQLIEQLPSSVTIYPIVSCGHSKIKGLFRFQCLIKAREIFSTLKHLPPLNAYKHFLLSIDVDPLSTYF